MQEFSWNIFENWDYFEFASSGIASQVAGSLFSRGQNMFKVK